MPHWINPTYCTTDERASQLRDVKEEIGYLLAMEWIPTHLHNVQQVCASSKFPHPDANLLKGEKISLPEADATKNSAETSRRVPLEFHRDDGLA